MLLSNGMKSKMTLLFKASEGRNGKTPATPTSDSDTSSESETGPGDSVSVTSQANEERKFELRDINIVFPEGKLTLITGPSKFSEACPCTIS